MNIEQLGSWSTFAQHLRQHLAAVTTPGPELPDAQEIERLVELAFFASLHEEEGRRIEFTLAWTGGTPGDDAIVTMHEPVVATPRNIAKLAPATQRDATSLALRRDGETIVIWALLRNGSLVESPLMIRSLSPGVLHIDYAGSPRALYARGETLLLGESHTVKSPARRLTAAFTCWAEGAAPLTRIDARAATVTRIAARALHHGHGGMILLVPANAEPHGVRVHYAIQGGADVLAKRYAELVNGCDETERLARIAASRPRAVDGRIGVRDEAQIRYDEAIDFVARLTATDNALLLDTDLHVLGFGTQVIESDAPLQRFEHVNPYTADMHIDDISTFKGTRHPAGVIFTLRQPGEAAAIIASQDDRLSLVVKDARGVVEVLGSYERGFGWR
jgi:hypothetical protein